MLVEHQEDGWHPGIPTQLEECNVLLDSFALRLPCKFSLPVGNGSGWRSLVLRPALSVRKHVQQRVCRSPAEVLNSWATGKPESPESPVPGLQRGFFCGCLTWTWFRMLRRNQDALPRSPNAVTHPWYAPFTLLHLFELPVVEAVSCTVWGNVSAVAAPAT